MQEIINKENRYGLWFSNIINHDLAIRYFKSVTPKNINYIAFCFDRQQGGIYAKGFEFEPKFNGNCWSNDWMDEEFILPSPNHPFWIKLKHYLRIENSLVTIRNEKYIDINSLL